MLAFAALSACRVRPRVEGMPLKRKKARGKLTLSSRSAGGYRVRVHEIIDQPWALLVVSFTVLLVTVESGFRLRQKTAADIDDSVQELIVAARGAISVLLSLLGF